ncbi:hypothetical protein A2300_04305 [Candidatus Falkowbacteria bacterium RIFOXYB2_FULL_35_7]|nr:MAG: hypothetical protein A2300_04305 [Candidatus Falkowbacteria bacterium RIFOXYB2_FULL_35_7]
MPRHAPQSVTADAVVTINFYSPQPKIILINRLHPPFNEPTIYALPGGHVKSGTFNPENLRFENGDQNTLQTAIRELLEETNLDLTGCLPNKWRALPIMDSDNRDPRPDARHFSQPYWINITTSGLSSKSLQAGDDANAVYLSSLLWLHPNDMAFDHWYVIFWLQKYWRQLNSIWTTHYTESKPNQFRHFCQTIPTNFEIIYLNEQNRGLVVITPPSVSPFEINYCPFCSADLSIKPFI